VLSAITVAAEDSTKLVLPATNELIWGTIAFVLFLLVLWRAGVWRRLGQALDERTKRIRSDLERAEQARKESEEVLERYRRQLDEGRDEARRMVDEARQSADQARKDILAKAQEDSNRIIEGARREIQAERDRAARELRREVGILAVQVAERVVGSELDGDRQRKLIDDYIAELEREPSPNGSGRRG
jgi:F-type H+-transporting ATPase subunit b